MPTKRQSSPRWRACNVLHAANGTRRLWQFAQAANGPAPVASIELNPQQPLPSKLARRDWRHLFRPTLNIAWLPADHVHLRVVHLPKCEHDELRSMVELQLEKLSPAPLNQIVWSFESIPHPDDTLLTVVVVVAERARVEAYLGTLENDGYLADRLVIPWLHPILDSPPSTPGTWIYIVPRDLDILCLAAWWYQGALQHLDLLQLSQQHNPASMLADHLTRVAWGAEIDGWLNQPPAWHLVLDDLPAHPWIADLQSQLGDNPELHPAPALADLARLAARRALRRESSSNLLPPEFTARYQQQFIDRLWMRGLGAVIVLYLFGLLFYFGTVQFLDRQRVTLQREVAQLSGSYTNALHLKERVRLFEEQADLKFAALDSLRVAAELLPTELTLTSFRFQGGKAVFLAGTVPLEHRLKVTEYNDELRRATVNGVPLFRRDGVQPPSLSPVASGGYAWNFNAELHRSTAE